MSELIKGPTVMERVLKKRLAEMEQTHATQTNGALAVLGAVQERTRIASDYVQELVELYLALDKRVRAIEEKLTPQPPASPPEPVAARPQEANEVLKRLWSS
jgi:hypothetical protein